ncbi:hypothetical protein EXIGLDRAFT_832434 [Exidia glandulosa HHB12029]|uniref:Uncharacterized protein n=1 Tax=Exidia glandulosa HHB12029 TaxID=1314781 RepID=A0A165LQD9_EXIGL|nr:hypothetical protein EXIGLDRAFT_832434 [Exidia glandulosa HHB12029]
MQEPRATPIRASSLRPLIACPRPFLSFTQGARDCCPNAHSLVHVLDYSQRAFPELVPAHFVVLVHRLLTNTVPGVLLNSPISSTTSIARRQTDVSFVLDEPFIHWYRRPALITRRRTHKSSQISKSNSPAPASSQYGHVKTHRRADDDLGRSLERPISRSPFTASRHDESSAATQSVLVSPTIARAWAPTLDLSRHAKVMRHERGEDELWPEFWRRHELKVRSQSRAHGARQVLRGAGPSASASSRRPAVTRLSVAQSRAGQLPHGIGRTSHQRSNDSMTEIFHGASRQDLHSVSDISEAKARSCIDTSSSSRSEILPGRVTVNPLCSRRARVNVGDDVLS